MSARFVGGALPLEPSPPLEPFLHLPQPAEPPPSSFGRFELTEAEWAELDVQGMHANHYVKTKVGTTTYYWQPTDFSSVWLPDNAAPQALVDDLRTRGIRVTTNTIKRVVATKTFTAEDQKELLS